MLFLGNFILKSTGRAQVLLKKSAGDFKTALRLRDQHVFYVTVTGDFESFHYFNDTHMEKLFYSIQYKNGWLALKQLESVKALKQLMCRLLVRWKNALEWKKCSISMFSQIFSPYNHVLAALFRKWEINFPRL